MNTLPEKLFFFCGKPFIEPFSNFFEIAEVLLCKRVSHWCEEVIDGARSKDYSGGERMSHPSDFKVSFASCDVWDGALSCNKISFLCLLAHSGLFSIYAWFKLIIVDDSIVSVGHHPVTPAIPRLRTSVFHIEIATFKFSKPYLTCPNRWSVFAITIPLQLMTFHSLFLRLNKKSNPRRKCSFSGTHVDMITERYNTDDIVWRTQLLCVCRLMSGEQTDLVSNPYRKYYSVRSSLRKKNANTYEETRYWLLLIKFNQFSWGPSLFFCVRAFGYLVTPLNFSLTYFVSNI